MKSLKRVAWLALIAFACEASVDTQEQTPPDPSRFVQEVFASNLYEPTELVVLPKNKILFTQRRGGIKQYNIKTGVLSDYDSIPVYFEKEDGLMGIALDPEFDQNEWVYVYYSPVGNEPLQHLSRFSYTPDGLTNEVVMLKVPVQREECCHTGGSIEFGPEGLLYLSTGDNSNPFDSDGFSPSDERPGRSAWDAQRSSSNTNDLRGKILRIKPQPDGTYTIPEGNLFEDDDPLTRPEIYVMGCRNPYRIAIDQKRGWLIWGDVGPDATNDNEFRGPKGHDEFNVAIEPGYFGWPLFVGNNYPYREYDFATGNTGDAYDPAKPINNSPNNTGLQELPPARPAKIYYPYARTDIFPQVKNGGRNAMAGPVYYSDMYEGARKFPSYLDGRVLFFDWMRDFIYFLEFDDEGNPMDWYQFAPDVDFNNVIDMTFGPDGALYMVEYGTGWFTRNENAKLSRFTFIKGNRPPVLKTNSTALRGAAPMTVTFDASLSYDPDGDRMTFQWLIRDQLVSSDSVFTYTFEKEGVYYPEIILKDQKGNKKRQQFVVEVGNEPPVVSIEIVGNQSFFWKDRKISYDVAVSDLEDERAAGINKSNIKFEIDHFQSSDQAEKLGHQQPVSNGLSLIQSLDCMACHKVNDQSIGPSYTEVAERYKDDEQAVNYLSYKIINGGGGIWGEQAMSAHPDLSTKDASAIVNYILSLGQNKEIPLEGEFVTTKTDGQYLFSATYTDGGKTPLKPIKVTENVWLRSTQVPGDQFSESKNIQARGGVIRALYDGSWVMFEDLDLEGISAVSLEVERLLGAKVTIRSGSIDGQVIGEGAFLPDEASNSSILNIPINPQPGKNNIYFQFANNEEKNRLMYVLYFNFIP